MTAYWIQRHGYSSDKVCESRLAKTLKAFNDIDWELELNKFQKNTQSKDYSSGIGINISTFAEIYHASEYPLSDVLNLKKYLTYLNL